MHGPLKLAGALSALLTTACASTGPEQWTLPTKAVPVRSEVACRQRISVAVEPLADVRPPTDTAGSTVGWLMLGLLFSPDYENVTTFGPRNPRQPHQYVYDDGRLFAMYLQRELANAGCFEVVAFDPRFAHAYDVVIGGRIVNSGKRVEAPFVPIPAWFGTVTASMLAKAGVVVEVELEARAPGTRPFFRYAVQGVCSDDECTSGTGRAAGFSRALRDGYEPFVRDFHDYVASREPAFWRGVRDARLRRFAEARDPEIASLARASQRDDACGAASREELARRMSMLTTMMDELARAEHAWAALSWKHIDQEVRQANLMAKLAMRTHSRYARPEHGLVAPEDHALLRKDSWAASETLAKGIAAKEQSWASRYETERRPPIGCASR